MSNVESQRSRVENQNSRPATCDFRLTTNREAFSLIELIVVMLVIGILAVTAVVKFTGTESYNTRLAAQQLRAHLTYIRNMAMNRERTTRVVFNKAANNYTVWIDATGTGAFVTAKDPVTQRDWIVDIGDSFRDVVLSAVDIGVSGGTNLYFSETNGAPFYAVWAPLATTGTVTFNSGLRVTIAPVTGRADLD